MKSLSLSQIITQLKPLVLSPRRTKGTSCTTVRSSWKGNDCGWLEGYFPHNTRTTLEHPQGCHHAARSRLRRLTSLLMSPCGDGSRPSAAPLFPFPQSQPVLHWWAFFSHLCIYKNFTQDEVWMNECIFNWMNNYKVGNLQRDLNIPDE